MAASVSVKKTGVAGDLRMVIADVTLDSSYPANGYVLAASDFGQKGGTIQTMTSAGSTRGGYSVAWDDVNSKLKAFRQSAATSALTEPTGVNLSAEVVRVIAYISGV